MGPTQVTIWLAMALWCLAMIWPRGSSRVARVLSSLGFVAYAAHIFSAYAGHYAWSHRIAWEETARDTRETVGIDSGIGLIVNFAFLLVLATDLVFQWWSGRRRGAPWIDGMILFLILNGAVVFGEGAVRIYGVILLLVTIIGILARFLRGRGNSAGSSFPLP